MTDTAEVYVTIDAPPVEPRLYGLFSVAPPFTPDDVNWQLGVRWAAGPGCAVARPTVDQCITGTVPGPLVPDESYCNWYGTKPFNVYVLGRRSLPRSRDVAEAEAAAALAAAEERAVEQHLFTEILAAATVGPTYVGDGSARKALGWIEHAIASFYNGRGVIHMSRFAASMLSQQLFVSGSTLVTRLGTPVVAGAGYGTAAGDELVMAGSGALVAYRGPVDTDQQAMNRAVNDYDVLAQRAYAVGWDCVAVKSAATESPAP